MDALAAEIGGDGAGGEEQASGEPDADLGEADGADAEDLSGHHLFGADGGEHDLEDARGLLLDDGAGDIHAVEHDDHVHEEEEDEDTDFGGLAVLAMGGLGGADVDRLEDGVGVGGDDAAVGKLLAHEDGGEGGGEGASQGVLFGRPWGKDEGGTGRPRLGGCGRGCDPEVAVEVAGIKFLVEDGLRGLRIWRRCPWRRR